MKLETKVSAFQTFAKYLLLAEVASDAGKGLIQTNKNNIRTAEKKGYEVKNLYIAQALSTARLLHNVSTCVDNAGIIYFDIANFGQVSFHTFKNWKKYHLSVDDNAWNENIGGSVYVCKKLAKQLNLPFYK